MPRSHTCSGIGPVFNLVEPIPKQIPAQPWQLNSFVVIVADASICGGLHQGRQVA